MIEQRKTVFFVVIAVAAIASTIVIASKHVATQSPTRPPRIVLQIGNTTVDGVLGSFCKDKTKQKCLTRLKPRQLATKAALTEGEVRNNTKIAVRTVDGPGPSNISINISSDTSGFSELYNNATISTNLNPGSYFVVVRAKWPTQNATYIYQINVAKQSN